MDAKDDIDWIRRAGRTPSYNTGPRFDHTLQSSTGHYIYIETSGIPDGSIARLESPFFKQSGYACEMSFAYSMFGQGIGTLEVTLESGGASTVLWSRSGNQGSSWQTARVLIQSRSSLFRIIFNATHGFGFNGDIALDDIIFKSCDPALVPRPCDTTKFTCANKLCISKVMQCDYSDDCGDGSDETASACQSFSNRCDFETGMCGYENDKLSDSFDWSPGRGESASVNTGPPNDHTTRTPEG